MYNRYHQIERGVQFSNKLIQRYKCGYQFLYFQSNLKKIDSLKTRRTFALEQTVQSSYQTITQYTAPYSCSCNISSGSTPTSCIAVLLYCSRDATFTTLLAPSSLFPLGNSHHTSDCLVTSSSPFVQYSTWLIMHISTSLLLCKKIFFYFIKQNYPLSKFYSKYLFGSMRSQMTTHRS